MKVSNVIESYHAGVDLREEKEEKGLDSGQQIIRKRDKGMATLNCALTVSQKVPFSRLPFHTPKPIC